MNKFMIILPITSMMISNVSFAGECPVKALVGKYKMTSSECTGLSCTNTSHTPWIFNELWVSAENGSDFINLSEYMESSSLSAYTHQIKQVDFDQPDQNFWTYCSEGNDLTGKFNRTLGYVRTSYNDFFETNTEESLQLILTENRTYAIQDMVVYSKDYVPQTEYRFTIELEKS